MICSCRYIEISDFAPQPVNTVENMCLWQDLSAVNRIQGFAPQMWDGS